MDIKGCTALVTGANRGLGKAYVDALFAHGAAKVYAGARDPATVADSRATPLQLDVTSSEQIARAVSACPDVTLLINNAGAMLATPIIAPNAEAALRAEMEVNVFGVLRMANAFAPVLARNGGGAIANMLSVVSWYVYPFNATYCATKHAALAVTNALRVQLKGQGTQVSGVYAGFIDTDMAAAVEAEKTPPAQVAERTLEGIIHGLDHVYSDVAAEDLWAIASSSPAQLEAMCQALWDAGPPTWAV
ncbi:Putative oxidoreductase [Sphingobium indicum BiD32]|uniref:Oxidoreductase n=1 Tax=Sphingobium indicum BiD32 TaxID=1301087 RepID=N1MUN8_9SPHN|nr:SDR family oxidoreductase [Sphingobium indicum]CCW19063.1 Putative oxidoreductase [Sphingobium indicum BiD32]